MPWTNPTTRSTGNVITAAIWNADVVDNLDWLGGEASGGKPSCRIFNSANIVVANNINTALTFNSERWDNGAMHSTVTNTDRITVPSGGGGKYLIGGHVDFAANATGTRWLGIQVNNTLIVAYTRAVPSGSYGTGMSIQTMYALSAGDYVQLVAYQDSGGNLNAQALGNYSPEFWAMWMAV